MKDTFNGWKNISKLPIKDVDNYILTGKKVEDFRPDDWLFKHIGEKETPLTVLDFGSGMGRNTYGIALYSPQWNVMGYDNDGMIELTKPYCTMKYGVPNITTNISFSSDWNVVKEKKFDAIFCCIVLQHIYEDALSDYIDDFKKMTKKLVIFGRRFNDDMEKRSNWTILEENGLTPSEFYSGGNKIPYSPNGDIHEHNTAIYNL